MSTPCRAGAAARSGLSAAAAVMAISLGVAPAAAAHPRVSPAVSLSGALQLYSLAVPTEKSGADTTKVVLTVPPGFAIDSLVPPPAGWHQQVQQSGSGDNAVITRVTWSGGSTPAGEDALFQFLAAPGAARSYSFQVEQSYSDGSIVNWSGPESSATPGPTIDAVRSLGGAGTPTLTIVALILAALALLAAGFALAGPRAAGRPLA